MSLSWGGWMNDMISIQPMSSPTNLLYYLDWKANENLQGVKLDLVKSREQSTKPVKISYSVAIPEMSKSQWAFYCGYSSVEEMEKCL